MVFIEFPLFQKYLSFSDEEMRMLQNILLGRPDAGTVIVSGKGLRKMRLALPGRGKRGGARVIYYWQVSKSQCLLLFAYPKNLMEDLTDKQVNVLAKMIEAEFPNG